MDRRLEPLRRVDLAGEMSTDTAARARRAASHRHPQTEPRAGSAALVPGISVRYSENARWAGWEVRASRQEEQGRQRLKTWTLSAHDLDAALLAAAEWRGKWTGHDPQETYRAARRAIPAALRAHIKRWRSEITG